MNKNNMNVHVALADGVIIAVCETPDIAQQALDRSLVFRETEEILEFRVITDVAELMT